MVFLLYSLGPHPSKPILSDRMPEVPKDLHKLREFVQKNEDALSIKEGNKAEIIWASDTNPQKTKLSLVYLHGFSASEEEGNPIHREFAKRYGCNLYLSRLAYHGLKDSEPLLHLTADSLYNSAKSALSIGTQLGDSVILMATSAGGALALTLAAKEQNIPIKGLILYSPCIEIFDQNAKILDKPWGLTLARWISNGNYIQSKKVDSAGLKFWYTKYRLEGLVSLQNFLDFSMSENTFEKVKIPVLSLLYFKDEKYQDSTVNVKAIRKMFGSLGTLPSQKELVELPNVGNHVLASKWRSKDLNSVRKATFDFAEAKLGLKAL